MQPPTMANASKNVIKNCQNAGGPCASTAIFASTIGTMYVVRKTAAPRAFFGVSKNLMTLLLGDAP